MQPLSLDLYTPAAAQREREMLAAVRFMHQKGWCPATSSNFSYRHPAHPGVFFISVSGKDKGDLTEGNFIPVDFSGVTLAENRHRPSAKILLHALAYDKLPETQAVVHTHSVNGTVISKLYEADGALNLHNFELLKGLEGIQTHQAEVLLPVFPNSQDMAALAADVRAWWDGCPQTPYGFLLAGHGLFTWGDSVEQARRHAEVFEFLFECILKLKAHGHPDFAR